MEFFCFFFVSFFHVLDVNLHRMPKKKRIFASYINVPSRYFVRQFPPSPLFFLSVTENSYPSPAQYRLALLLFILCVEATQVSIYIYIQKYFYRYRGTERIAVKLEYQTLSHISSKINSSHFVFLIILRNLSISIDRQPSRRYTTYLRRLPIALIRHIYFIVFVVS